MRLEKLKLHNFMAYKGDHEIDFTVSSHSPLILFLGENGHGKSSIQNACKWCLYDQTEDLPNSDLINRKAMSEFANDPTLSMSVTLSWTDEDKSYELFRVWEPNGSDPTSSHPILRIDGGNAVSSNAVQDFVQRFLAKEISHFFFFDGETQKEFDAMATSNKGSGSIRSEIEKTLSIPVITDAINWFKLKQTEESDSLVRANAHNEKIRKSGLDLENQRETRSKLQHEHDAQVMALNNTNRRIELIESELKSFTASQELSEEIATLRGEKIALQNQRKEKLSLIKDVLSNNGFWAPLSGKLLEMKSQIDHQIQVSSKAFEENRDIASTVKFLEKLQATGSCPICKSSDHSNSDHIKAEIKDLEARMVSVSNEEMNKLQEKSKLFALFGFNPDLYVDLRNLQKEYDSLGGELSRVENRISDREIKRGTSPDADVQNAVMSLKSLMDDKNSADQNIEYYKQQLAEADKKISRLESQVGKEISPEKRVAHNAFSYLLEVFESSKDVYVADVREQVEKFSSETFLKIISDKKYTGLRINENFGVELVLPDGRTDPLRSTGQGKVSTISLVSGLIRTAMDEGFILMDTPFVSLDNGHRAAVCKWASESGLRVSLFMHSGEFVWDRDNHYFQGQVGKIYRISKIDNDESEVKLEMV
jgi:DNA sulfur modification protein DndD